MARLLLSGGRVMDPAVGRDETADLLIADGRIAAVGPPGGLGRADQTLDCRHCLVVPGLIDLHVHLREPPLARRAPHPARHKAEAALAETIETGAAAAVAGGFTTVCAMPNTDPPIDTPDAVGHCAARGRDVGLARVLVVGAMTQGRRGEAVADLAAMRAAGAVAFSDDGSDVGDNEVFEAVLREAARIAAPVICHCEDPRLAAEGVMNDGPVAMLLGLPGIPAEAEEAAVARACDAAARTGCRVHVAHVSTAGAVEIIRRAKAAGAPVTAEATPHHLALTESVLASRRTVYKVNPPLRSAHDVQALIEGVRDGTIGCLATDHAPHTAEAKARRLAEAPFGMIGLESALGVYGRALLGSQAFGWPDLVARMTAGPARALGLASGTLAVGAEADVTVINPTVRWTIDPATFASRARNCPFAGWEVQGRAVLTIVGGRVVYERWT